LDNPSVTCVVLNWNGWQDTLACLAALHRTQYPNLSFIVVDNGSTDDSEARIRAEYPQIPLIQTGRNLGFAGGVNAGIRYALAQSAEYIWLLNNDAQPRPDALAAMVAKATSDPRFGAIGSVLLYADPSGNVQAWGGGRVNCWIGYTFHATAPMADSWFDYITAASILLPRRALEEIGLLDESFFLYWEDSDLSFRLRQHGWKLGVAANSTVLHKENASSANRRQVDRFSTASGVRFLRKHSPAAWLAVPLFITLRIGNRFVRGKWSGIGDIVGGVRDYLRPQARP
jgi:GT2 family glycosyltransferase